MKSDPKIKREIDKDYLKFIKEQPPLVVAVGDENIVAHHDPSIGAGGSDYMALPLPVSQHIPGVHRMGRDTFQKEHGLDFNKERVRLLIKYILKLKRGYNV